MIENFEQYQKASEAYKQFSRAVIIAGNDKDVNDHVIPFVYQKMGEEHERLQNDLAEFEAKATDRPAGEIKAAYKERFEELKEKESPKSINGLKDMVLSALRRAAAER